MPKKIFGILIIVAGLVICAGIVFVVFFGQQPLSWLTGLFSGGSTPMASTTAKNNGTQTPAGNGQLSQEVKHITIPNINSQTPSNTGQNTGQAPSQTSVTKDELMRMAGSFAERFGSYSNQSNFSNITDLKIFMSQRMRDWADSYINEQRLKGTNNSIYYGITTKAVGEEITKYDDDLGKVSILVHTRRREAANSTANTTNVFNQDVIINFVKENGAWEVDSANWQ